MLLDCQLWCRFESMLLLFRDFKKKKGMGRFDCYVAHVILVNGMSDSRSIGLSCV